MNGFHIIGRLPLKRKLMLIIMVTSMLGLLLAGVLFSVYERYRIRLSLVHDLTALSRLIGDRSTAALLFDDPRTAGENLSVLRVKPNVTAACIYAENGAVFATYTSEEGFTTFPPAEKSSVHRFNRDTLMLFEPIVLEGKRIGTIHIQAGLQEVKSLWRQFLLVTVLIIASAGSAAFLVFSKLQRVVTGPLSEIAKIARLITQKKDYSVRAAKSSDEETALLVQAFNEMLEQIQRRDRELLEANVRLESQVQARTAELRTSAESLRVAAEEQRAIFEAASSGIVLIKDRIILRCNPGIEKIFGYAPGELIGRSTRDWYPDEATFQSMGAGIAASMASGAVFMRELEMVRKDGSRFWGRTRVQPVDRAAPSRGVVGVIDDITAEREHGEVLKIAKERAESADRLKSAFLATMSHELRTPLNSIIGFTGIILQGLPGPLNAEQRKQLEMVRGSARHLLALINDVLDISKIEAGQLEVVHEPFDLRASIGKVAGLVKPLAEKKDLALHIELMPEIGRAVSDQRRVEQVLLNLLNNAIKFTERGEVSLRVWQEKAAPGIGVENTEKEEARRGEGGVPVPSSSASVLHFQVADTGIGIKQEDLAALFQPFRQIDSGLTRQQEGTGLGLAICRRLAKLMGGEIHAESELGKGSTFTFMLPAE